MVPIILFISTHGTILLLLLLLFLLPYEKRVKVQKWSRDIKLYDQMV